MATKETEVSFDVSDSFIQDERLKEIIESESTERESTERESTEREIILYCQRLDISQRQLLLNQLTDYMSGNEGLEDNAFKKLEILKRILNQESKSLEQRYDDDTVQYKKNHRILGGWLGYTDETSLKAKCEDIEKVFCVRWDDFKQQMPQLSIVDALKLVQPMEIPSFKKYADETYFKSKKGSKDLIDYNHKYLQQQLKDKMCKDPKDFVQELRSNPLDFDPQFLLDPRNERLFGLTGDDKADERKNFYTNTNLLKHVSLVTSLEDQQKNLEQLYNALDQIEKAREVPNSPVSEESLTNETDTSALLPLIDEDFVKLLNEFNEIRLKLKKIDENQGTVVEDSIPSSDDKTALEKRIWELSQKLEELDPGKAIEKIGKLDRKVSVTTLPENCCLKSLKIEPQNNRTYTIKSMVVHSKEGHELKVQTNGNNTHFALTPNSTHNREQALSDLVFMAYDKWLKSKNPNKPITVNNPSEDDKKFLIPLLRELIDRDSKVSFKFGREIYSSKKLPQSSESATKVIKDKLRSQTINAQKGTLSQKFIEPDEQVTGLRHGR